MKKIPLGHGKFAKVDDQDFEKVKIYKWHLHSEGYARNVQMTYMHRLISGASRGVLVDHANADRLDNRRSNLRLVTKSQNMMNRGKTSKSTSGFRGIYFEKRSKRWVARVCSNHKTIWLGSFENKDDAIRARLAGEKKYYGQYAFQS